MSTAKTIDVKGLEHSEREKLILPTIHGLENGQAVRIALEFNPLPLVYMLKAQNEFDVSFEKEGPDEWILRVKRIAAAEGDKKESLKALLRELKDGTVSEETKAKAAQFFNSIDATTLGVVEQELIREGVSHDEIRKSLCDIHLEALRDSLVAQRIEVEAPHPVNTLMEEHKFILEGLQRLTSVLNSLKKADSYRDSEDDIEELKEVSHFLVDAENHHQREEEVLFPKLQEHDIVEPPEIMKLDHTEFRKRKQGLFKISNNHEEYDFEAFKGKVLEYGEFIAEGLESHIFKEDNILYQIALQVLTPEDWEQVKKDCDKIGYCCFKPVDQR